jgi:hypothetical protein
VRNFFTHGPYFLEGAPHNVESGFIVGHFVLEHHLMGPDPLLATGEEIVFENKSKFRQLKDLLALDH